MSDTFSIRIEATDASEVAPRAASTNTVSMLEVAGLHDRILVLSRPDGSAYDILARLRTAVHELLAPSFPPDERRRMVVESSAPRVELTGGRPVIDIDTLIAGPLLHRAPIDLLMLDEPLADALWPGVRCACPHDGAFLAPTDPAAALARISAARAVNASDVRLLLGAAFTLAPAPADVIRRNIDLLIDTHRTRGIRRFAIADTLLSVAEDVPFTSSPGDPVSSSCTADPLNPAAPPRVVAYLQSFGFPPSDPAEVIEEANRLLTERGTRFVFDLVPRGAAWDGTSHVIARSEIGRGLACPLCSFERPRPSRDEIRFALRGGSLPDGTKLVAGTTSFEALSKMSVSEWRMFLSSQPRKPDAPLCRTSSSDPSSIAHRSLDALNTAGLARVVLTRLLVDLSDGERLKTAVLALAEQGISGAVVTISRSERFIDPAELKDSLGAVLERLADAGNTIILGTRKVPAAWAALPLLEESEPTAAPATAQTAQAPEDPAPVSGKHPPAKRRASKKPSGDDRHLHVVLPNGEPLSLPRGTIIAITGPSGSGKSRMLLSLATHFAEGRSGRIGVDPQDRLRLFAPVTAQPISPRQRMSPSSARAASATPSTAPRASGSDAARGALLSAAPRTVAAYLGVAAPLARIFAATHAARDRALPASAFQLDEGTARCTRCNGRGIVAVDLDFAGKELEPCDLCAGTRFESSPLTVIARGASIGDIYGAPLSTVLKLFGDDRDIASRLAPAIELGSEQLILGVDPRALDPFDLQLLALARFFQRTKPRRRIMLLNRTLEALDEKRLTRALDELARVARLGGTALIETHRESVIVASSYVLALREDGSLASFAAPKRKR